MENLISPEEVALQAFAPLDRVTPADVNPLTIAVAQERFIVPVLGAAMVEALAAGNYAELLDESVAPALALYTRVLMIPALALRIGSANDGDWTDLHTQATSDIVVAHSWFRALSGLDYSSGFNADRILHEYEIALNTVILAEQAELMGMKRELSSPAPSRITNIT